MLRIGYNPRISEKGEREAVTRPERALRTIALAIVCCGGIGCSAVTSSMTGRLADSLAVSILNQNDPETVRQGAPAYLLMIDGFIADDPENIDVLLAAAQLNSSYAGAFVDDPERQSLMAEKARDLAWKASCLSNKKTCGMWQRPYDEFESVVDTLGPHDLAAAYAAATAWAGWIEVNSDDWIAVADKARVEKLILHVVELKPDYSGGDPYLYLGVLATLIPEALGGRPEDGRRYFERAFELSGGTNLMAKVLLAREYARATFDRELHDRLCREVLDAEPKVDGRTLANTLAQHEARALLDDSEDYFGE